MTRVPPPWLAPAPNTAAPTARLDPSPHSTAAAPAVSTSMTVEIAVAVIAGDLPDEPATVGEGDRHLVTAQVVRVGQDLARGDHDAGSARVPADPDDGRPDPLRDGGDGRLEFFDGAHVLLLRSLRFAMDAIDL